MDVAKLMNQTFSKLAEYIDQLDISQISPERQLQLDVLKQYISNTLETPDKARLNFICTHNSRRSHLCQVWSRTMAYFYAVDGIKSYSGGTEVTAVFPMIIQTLRNTGFVIHQLGEGDNPTYKLNFTDEKCPMTLFSKVYNDSINPKDQFAAVMTCNSADANCPFIPGATRISLTYDDPKAFDNTSLQEEKYLERSTQIATEMKYIFSQIN